jgi:polyprenyl-phospho-N-acetylgalactosaminyl synthase
VVFTLFTRLTTRSAAAGLRYVEQPVTIEYTAYSLAKGQKLRDAVLILLDLFARRLYR